MFLFKRVEPTQSLLKSLRQRGLQIGFVPTMGALHEGHLSLLRQAKAACDIAVCSIFVNPTQFNDPADLKKYPRRPERDLALLFSVGADLLFLPGVAAVYPTGTDTPLPLDLDPLDKVMEGAFRPGHFEGVAQVVKRLLDIVEPHMLFMGQKDYQQTAVIRRLLDWMETETQLVVGPTVREPDGLAMSSRNVRLKPEDRQRAPLIYETLLAVREKMDSQSPPALSEWAMAQLQIAGWRPEYFQIVDGTSLLPVDQWNKVDSIVACTAVWAGDVRLIDNVILR